MDNNLNDIQINTHEVKISDRGILYFTGINKILSFDHEEFLMESIMGSIILKGEDLEIVKLDTHDGNVKIKGKVNSIAYFDGTNVNKHDSLLSKIFK